MVDGERNVGVQRFADRLAVIDGLGIGQQFQVGFQTVGDPEQDVGAGRRIGLAPLREGSVGGIQCQLDILGGGTGNLGVGLAVDRGDHVEVLTLDRGNPLAADEILVNDPDKRSWRRRYRELHKSCLSPVFWNEIANGLTQGWQMGLAKSRFCLGSCQIRRTAHASAGCQPRLIGKSIENNGLVLCVRHFKATRLFGCCCLTEQLLPNGATPGMEQEASRR